MYRDSLSSLDSVAKFFDVNHRGAKSIIYAMLERKLVAETPARAGAVNRLCMRSPDWA
jgi:hypothetical protein